MNENKYNLINSIYISENNMSVLANTKPNSFVINARNSSKFIIESNKKTISKSLLDECKKYI